MNFDPISYAIQRADALQARVRQIEENQIAMVETLAAHGRRIDSIERWRASWRRMVNRWPLLAMPAILIALNLAPEATVKLILETIKAAL